MKIYIKQFNELTNKELYNIIKLRLNVFVYEQKILVEDELDQFDFSADHYFIKNNSNDVVSYARLIKEEGFVKLGRICTAKLERGKGYSSKIIENVITTYNRVIISSQEHAISFYEKLGFIKTGTPYLEANISHQRLIYEK